MRTRWASTVGATAVATVLLHGRVPRALWWGGVLGACGAGAWRIWRFLQQPE